MAFLEFENVGIVGISAGVPQTIASNLHPSADDNISREYTPEEFVKVTGVKERRTSSVLTTSDLCYHAAEQLIRDLGWEKESIGALLFVSQTPDYILPATACILQDRLGLGKECFAEDISLGCSGWVYGLSTALGLLKGDGIRRALVLCGDAKKRFRVDSLLRLFPVAIPPKTKGL